MKKYGKFKDTRLEIKNWVKDIERNKLVEYERKKGDHEVAEHLTNIWLMYKWQNFVALNLKSIQKKNLKVSWFLI